MCQQGKDFLFCSSKIDSISVDPDFRLGSSKLSSSPERSLNLRQFSNEQSCIVWKAAVNQHLNKVIVDSDVLRRGVFLRQLFVYLPE